MQEPNRPIKPGSGQAATGQGQCSVPNALAGLARSGCRNAVLGVLLPFGLGWPATRQYLREWLHDGADRAALCGVQLDVEVCFAPLLRWVLAWWEGTDLTLTVDPTAKGGAVLVALVVSVVYRGLAIPVAWRIRTGDQPGPWMPDLCVLLDRLGPTVPSDMTVRVLCDRGLQNPDLWAAWRFVAGEGQYTVTAGKAFRERKRRCTLIVLWMPDREALGSS